MVGVDNEQMYMNLQVGQGASASDQIIIYDEVVNGKPIRFSHLSHVIVQGKLNNSAIFESEFKVSAESNTILTTFSTGLFH